MGQILNGRYELEAKVGDGGMAVVYQGRDRVLGRPVAIKVLRDQYVSDAAFLNRFRREAQAAAALSHPNIVNIYDVGEDHGLHYIVMEFVPGRNLKEIIRAQGPLSARQTVDLGRQICLALSFAHQRDLVHRDVKPQNILVTPDGLVKVADFGIAKGLNDSHLTATGVAMGTVHYAAPEQVEGKEAVPASDIYAVGVVLYEMLTGRLPFEGETPVSIALKHINETPLRLRSFNPQVPTGLETVVLTALAKEPGDRFPTAEALAQALVDYQFYSSPRTAHLRSSAGARTAAVPVQRLTAANQARSGEARPAVESRPSVAARTATATRTYRNVPGARPRDDIGCLTWIAGVAGLGILLGLLLFAFTMLPRLIGQAPGASPTVIAKPSVVATAPASGNPPPTAPSAAKPAPTAPPVVAPATSPTASPTPTVTPTPTATPVTASPTPAATATPVPRLADLRGKTLAEAQQLLQPLGVTLVENRPGVFNDQVPAGRIVSQEPAPNATVAPGSTVRVTLSRGAAIMLPDLRNQELAAATKQLSDVGLTFKTVEEAHREIAAGRVIRSDPGAGTQLSSGMTVTLVISVGDKVRVPDVFNKPVEEARRLVAEAGLVVGSVTEQTRDQVPEVQRPAFDRVIPGGVLSATPTYGTWVQRGTIVTIAIRKR